MGQKGEIKVGKKPYDLAKELCDEARSAGLVATMSTTRRGVWNVVVRVNDKFTLSYVVRWGQRRGQEGRHLLILSFPEGYPVTRIPFSMWPRFFKEVAAASKKK